MGALAVRNQELTQRVDNAIDKALGEERLVGIVVLIARDGEVVYRRAAGSSDRESGTPMRENTIGRYASFTKPIVTAAAMAMLDRGLIGLDDPVTRWLPEFRPKTTDGREPTITVRHLLTHTAGMSYGFRQQADGPYRSAGVSDGFDAVKPGFTMKEQLRRLATVPLSYDPGTRWGYSVAMDVMGEVVARASGVALPGIVESLITQPLEMVDSGFAVHDIARLATPYVDGKPPRRMNDPDAVPFGESWEIRYSPSRIFDASSFASGGGGMAGTAPDFLKFLEAIRQGGGPILTPQSASAMMTNQIGDLRIDSEPVPAWGFGFGGAILLDPELAKLPHAPGTWKWGSVYGSHWYVDPSNRLTVVALGNTAIQGMNGEFVTELRNAIYGA